MRSLLRLVNKCNVLSSDVNGAQEIGYSGRIVVNTDHYITDFACSDLGSYNSEDNGTSVYYNSEDLPQLSNNLPRTDLTGIDQILTMTAVQIVLRN